MGGVSSKKEWKPLADRWQIDRCLPEERHILYETESRIPCYDDVDINFEEQTYKYTTLSTTIVDPEDEEELRLLRGGPIGPTGADGPVYFPADRFFIKISTIISNNNLDKLNIPRRPEYHDLGDGYYSHTIFLNARGLLDDRIIRKFKPGGQELMESLKISNPELYETHANPPFDVELDRYSLSGNLFYDEYYVTNPAWKYSATKYTGIIFTIEISKFDQHYDRLINDLALCETQ